jgi:hypothetical protein
MTLDLPKRVAENIAHFSGRVWLIEPVLDWLENSSRRLFILTGEPGAGKSMIAAWLAGEGPIPREAEQRESLIRIRAAAKGAHFCEAASGKTAPKALAKGLTEQLQDTVPPFRRALAEALKGRIQITVKQDIGTIESGGKAIAVNIENLNMARMSDEFSFNTLLREPLQELYRSGYGETILLVIDALDEALTYSGSPKIPDLLARLEDMPLRVRFLITVRHDPRVLKLFPTTHPLDLIKDAPKHSDDVRDFTWDGLTGLDEGPRSMLADRITKASEGNFLYAHLVLRSLRPRLAEVPDLEQLLLPDDLNGVYLDFLNRELGMNEARWNTKYGPVLGLIAVGQGDGLLYKHLKRFARKDVASALRDCKQYLDGDLPDGPFRPFHRSFADFLLDKRVNVHYPIDGATMHAKIVKDYCPASGCGRAWPNWDYYGVRYLATHLALAALDSGNGNGHLYAERLVRLMANDDFQAYHLSVVDDVAALQSDMEQALRTAAADEDPRSLTLVVEMALALVEFRRRRLQPEPIFELAREGKLEDAIRALAAFDVEKRWQTAAALALGWLAEARNPQASREAVSLYNRMDTEGLAPPWPIPLLLARVKVGVKGLAPGLPPLPPPPSKEVVEELIKRLAGQQSNSQVIEGFLSAFRYETWVPPAPMLTETWGQGSDDAPVFLAHIDGPPLISFAAAHPEEGRKYLDRYLAIFAANDYVYYRNLSLWILLDAVLRHPDPVWTREAVAGLVLVAMQGERLAFRNALPYALLAWRKMRGESDAQPSFTAQANQVLTSVVGVSKDMLGTIKRQLGALAEAAKLLPASEGWAEKCLDAIRHLPGGFAGYHATAWLTLADTARLCWPDDSALVQWALRKALHAAQNIQDEVFCVRMTARVNALRERPWERASASYHLVNAIQELTRNPGMSPCVPVHVVGLSYGEREVGPDKRSLPKEFSKADTLRQLAEVYRQPLSEFLQLNPGRNDDAPLASGTHVFVPDRDFAPLLAAHFAAEALADRGLNNVEKTRVIQSLVPIAASNLTALDTVLARLLLAGAALPADPAEMKNLSSIVPPPDLGLIAASSAPAPDRIIPISQAVDVVKGVLNGVGLDETLGTLEPVAVCFGPAADRGEIIDYTPGKSQADVYRRVTMMTCYKCSSSLPDGARFCPNCGEAIP